MRSTTGVRRGGGGCDSCASAGTKLAKAPLAPLRLGAGVQAAVTHGVLALGRNVGEDASDEVIDAQASLMSFAVTVAGVAEADVLVVLMKLTR